jgi:hypothetical protein
VAEAFVSEEEKAMSQKIGERELQLRAMREQGAKTKATLPATSGRKPVKKKRKVAGADPPRK